jgi:thiamine-phosphate pyrophosphorylase
MKPLRGLYAITSAALCAAPQRLLCEVEGALRGGAVLLQYRDKAASAAARLERAQQLQALCARFAVPLIINDDVELAARVGAGVHVGRSDATVAAARAALGAPALIGVSCGSDLQRAHSALAAGASYVAFGRFFDSRTKPDAPPATPAVLAQARAELPAGTPLCAIGGITPDNAAPLIAQGADLIAAVDGVFGGGDSEAAARAYARLFG